MEINKAAQAASSGAPTAVQLEAINNLAKAHLTAQQVYVFSLRLRRRMCMCFPCGCATIR